MVGFDWRRQDLVEDSASVSSSSDSVFFLFCWRFELVNLRGGWLLRLDMLLSRLTKLESQLDNCMAILHGDV